MVVNVAGRAEINIPPCRQTMQAFSSGLLTLTWLAGGNLTHLFDQYLFVLSVSGMWTHLYQVRVTERKVNPKTSVGSRWHDSRIILDTHLQHVAFSFTHAHGGTQMCLLAHRVVTNSGLLLSPLKQGSSSIHRWHEAANRNNPDQGWDVRGRSVTHTHVSTPLPEVQTHTHTHIRSLSRRLMGKQWHICRHKCQQPYQLLTSVLHHAWTPKDTDSKCWKHTHVWQDQLKIPEFCPCPSKRCFPACLMRVGGLAKRNPLNLVQSQ